MAEFRKKLVVIEATQWWKHGDHPEVGIYPADPRYGFIEALEGGHIVTPGDWIIKGIAGEYYPCKPDIFEVIYEAV